MDTYNRDNLADVEGIVLHEMKYMETSKILRVLTKEYGKISVMAQGAMKEKRALLSQTSTMAKSSFHLRKGGSFFYVNSAELLRSNGKIRSSYRQYLYGLFFCEIVDMAATEGQEQRNLFELLDRVLTILSESGDAQGLSIAFFMKLSAISGFRPRLRRCASCGGIPIRRIGFSGDAGGILCDDCMERGPVDAVMTKDQVVYLYRALHSPFMEIYSQDAKVQDKKHLHRLVAGYFLERMEIERGKTFRWLEAIGEL